MAVIYDFGEYRTPRLLRPPSQQTREVVRQCEDYRKHMNKVSVGLCLIQEAQRAFASQLNAYLSQLEKTREFTRRCSAACELNSIELMIKKRDQIIREMPKNWSAN